MLLAKHLLKLDILIFKPHDFSSDRQANGVLVTCLWIALASLSQKRSCRWLLTHRAFAFRYAFGADLTVPAKAVAGVKALVKAGIAFLHSYLHISHQLAKVAGLLRIVFLGGK